MRTSRNDGDARRRRNPATPPLQATRTQSFTCSADLLRAFEHRAFELGCSFDWLLEEAMQRLLAEGGEPETIELVEHDPPTPAHSVHQLRAFSLLAALPLPMPPNTTPPTLPPPRPARAQHQAPPPPPPSSPAPAPVPASVPAPVTAKSGTRSRTANAVAEPLVLYYGDERLEIGHHPYVIGRSASAADLVIDDTEVSRRHAVIEHTAYGWVITDLGSTNGIIVNGEAVRYAVLRPGAMMSIGPMAFRVAFPA
jgi:hypothetical protein